MSYLYLFSDSEYKCHPNIIAKVLASRIWLVISSFKYFDTKLILVEEKTTLLQRYLNRTKIIRRETVYNLNYQDTPTSIFPGTSRSEILKGSSKYDSFSSFFIDLTSYVVPRKMPAGGYPMIHFLHWLTGALRSCLCSITFDSL